MGNNKIALAIVALICGVYVISPDPFPVVIDDVIVGLIGAANILKMLKSSDETPRLNGKK